MTSSCNRQPSGTPVGGQFAAGTHRESTEALSDADVADVKKWLDASNAEIQEAFDKPVGWVVYSEDGTWELFNSEAEAQERAAEVGGVEVRVVDIGSEEVVLDGRVDSRTDRLDLQDVLDREAETAAEGELDLRGEETPWSWTTLSEGTSRRHAESLFDRFDGSLGRALAHVDEEWEAVGVTTKSAWRRCSKMNVAPEDFESDDRDVRLSACSARGDMVFDGELLSEAYLLSRHQVAGANGRRVVRGHAFGGEPWQSHTNDERLAYIDGYAAAVVSAERSRSNGSRRGAVDRGVMGGSCRGLSGVAVAAARSEGWLQGAWVERFRDDVSNLSEKSVVKVVDSSSAFGKDLSLRDVRIETDPSGHVFYTGEPLEGQQFVHDDGSTTPRLTGIRVRFEADAFVDYGS